MVAKSLAFSEHTLVGEICVAGKTSVKMTILNESEEIARSSTPTSVWAVRGRWREIYLPIIHKTEHGAHYGGARARIVEK